ncbi:MAG: hypothetical protein NT062_32685 [Proteobacteria bacterium]|nr:hypothetical protein [Pseudomonadota bacterium]
MGSLVATLVPGIAFAGAALDDAPKSEPAVDPNTGAVLTEAPDTEAPVEYGVGLRLRSVRIPQGMFELFTARAPGGMSNVGYGVELLRRRGNVELQLGFEHEALSVPSGVWIESGKSVPLNEADFILSEDKANSTLAWTTIEFTFINHAVINKYVSFRYGGGAGLGILSGDLKRVDVLCAGGSTNTNVDPGCVPPTETGPQSHQQGTATITEGPFDGSGHVYELPPVFPVVNAIIGLQFNPMPKMHINIEGGIRTMPFFGTSLSYFF